LFENLKNMTPEEKATIVEHLEDLRKALLNSIIAIVVCAIAGFYFSDQILAFVQRPLDALGLKLIFIGVTEGFNIKLKLAFYGGLVLAFPVIAFQIYRFVAPALYPNERKYVLILVPVMVLLFAGGAIFAYSVILQLAITFLVMIAGDLEPMLTADKYISFFLRFTLPFGVVFELPVVVYFLTRLRIVTPQWLAQKRKYALLVIFILAAILTPGGDVVSQCLMGIPVFILYELSIWISKWSVPKDLDDWEDDEDIEVSSNTNEPQE